MQNNILEFKRPAKTECECIACGTKWTVTYPITQDDLECEKCETKE